VPRTYLSPAKSKLPDRHLADCQRTNSKCAQGERTHRRRADSDGAFPAHGGVADGQPVPAPQASPFRCLCCCSSHIPPGRAATVTHKAQTRLSFTSYWRTVWVGTVRPRGTPPDQNSDRRRGDVLAADLRIGRRSASCRARRGSGFVRGSLHSSRGPAFDQSLRMACQQIRQRTYRAERIETATPGDHRHRDRRSQPPSGARCVSVSLRHLDRPASIARPSRCSASTIRSRRRGGAW
jgi:hypothetical protein